MHLLEFGAMRMRANL